MLRTGRVVSAGKGEVEVCFERPEACAHCGACAGQKEETRVRIPGDAPVGRWIDVDMPEGQVLKASALAYVLPLLMLLGGIALGSALSLKEVLCAALGVACMGLAFWALRLMEKRLRRREIWQPRIVAVRAEGETPCPACGGAHEEDGGGAA